MLLHFLLFAAVSWLRNTLFKREVKREEAPQDSAAQVGESGVVRTL